MGTINDQETVAAIIAGNGHYLGDPQVVKIVQYTNAFNAGISFGLIYKGEDPMRYEQGGAIINPRVIFEAV